MKKILAIAATIAVTAVANAASFSWSSTGTIYKPTDSTTAVSGFTAYLISTTTVTQDALVTALRDGGSITDYTALSTYTTDSAAKVATTAFTADGDQSAYFAIVMDDYVYISKVATKAASTVGTQNLAFGSQSTSSASVFGSDVSYANPGWYQTVPEPTSGLLMLLGMAGLALRRRRA
jgi:hypothetical protein